MRTFSELVLHAYVVSGTQSVYSDTRFAQLLGNVDHLTLGGFVQVVSSGTVTIQVEQSFDGTRWLNRSATPEVNGPAITAGTEFNINATDGSIFDRPKLPLVRLRVAMGGGAVGIVRLWASGRDPAR